MTNFHYRVLGLFESIDLAVVDLDNSGGWQVAHIVVSVVGCELKLIVLGGDLNITPVLCEFGVCVTEGAKLLELKEVLVDHEVDPLLVFAEASKLGLSKLDCASV